MCGIAGLISYKSPSRIELQESVSRQLDAMIHRGPDGWGSWIDENVGAALGQRRLAIIDLSEGGKQPMTSHSGRFVVTFNGEIYNFKSLRTELELLGHKFQSSSDTEVALAAMDQWGITAALKKFNGMFAFGIIDRHEQTLTLARDRFGEKPLYYLEDTWGVAFASELKGLRAVTDTKFTLCREALALYFRFNCVPAPYSIYNNVKKLLPAHLLTFKLRHRAPFPPSATCFWSLERELFDAKPFQGTDKECLDELDGHLRQSVKLRMQSDVPLGAFLSGGIDSSLIVALMQSLSSRPIKTFTIGSDNKENNEAQFAKDVATYLGTDHHELYLSGQDALDLIPSLPEIYDEPFSDSSQIPTYLVSKLAAETVKVVLSGDAGDELFGGYNRYLWVPKMWSLLKNFPRSLRKLMASSVFRLREDQWSILLQKSYFVLPSRLHVAMPGHKLTKLAMNMAASSPHDLYLQVLSRISDPTDLVRGVHEPKLLHRSFENWPTLGSFEDQMMFVDLMTYLPDDILVKTDRATMRASIEGRVPFLDPAVVQFAARLSSQSKIRRGKGKYHLRTLLTERYVPSDLIERPKQGFGIPIGQWLRGPLRSWAEDLLSVSKLERDGIINPDAVSKAWKIHLEGADRLQFHLWDILMFQAWKERWGSEL